MEMKPETIRNYQKNEALTFGAAAFIISLMMFCVGMTAVHFVSRLESGWNLSILPWITMLAAMEAIYSQQFTHRWSDLSWERISYRISEVLVILFLVKLVFYFRMGLAAARMEIAEYGLNFLEAFFTAEYVTVLIVSLLVWLIATRMSGLVLEMGHDEEILEPWARPDGYSDRQMVRKNLAGLAFFVGAAMIILGTFARQQLEFIWQDTPVIEATSLNIVVYFVLTLILLSLSQFSILRGRWGWEKTPIRGDIGQSWLKYAILFFALVFVLIILLPTDYSMGFFQTIGILFELAFNLLAFLVYLFMMPILFILSRLRGEEGTENLDSPIQDFRPETLPETPFEPLSSGEPMLDWVRAVFFWAVFLFVIFYAFIQFARNNEELWQRLKSIAVFGFLLGIWEGVRDWFFGVGRNAATLVQAGVRQIQNLRGGSVPTQLFDFIGINRLTPRRRIFFFYQAMLRRASEQHVGKASAQTPEEYSQRLSQAYPEAAPDIDTLTAEFEIARYSQQEVDEDDANKTKSIWARLRAVMRTARDV